MAFRAVLDTCVLYPMYLRDTLLRLATADLYQPLWSSSILTELRAVLVRQQVMPVEEADRVIRLMRTHFPDAEVTGYEPLIVGMTCDEKDRHVLACAVQGNAGMLVTANVSDFPPHTLTPFDVEVLPPDVFLLDLLDRAPHVVLQTLAAQADRYKREPTTIYGLLTALSRAGASGFADEVRRHLNP